MGKILFPKYFPICPTDGDEYIVPGATATLTSSAAATMKMFWRPKEITISGSYTQFNEDTRECDISANFSLVIRSPYTSEEEMVCEPIKPWTVASSTNLAENGFNWASEPYYYGQEDALFTFNSFDFGLDTGESPTPCNNGVLIKQLYPTQGGPYAFQPINILGVNFNMATATHPVTGRAYIQPSIAVTEWWSFGGTYSTTTGEPL